jgi:hypothetical protein
MSYCKDCRKRLELPQNDNSNVQTCEEPCEVCGADVENDDYKFPHDDPYQELGGES